ncbi:glycoside hydrolase family 71 protein [Laetiporus sulphureus 93-53]|uniref:Glycoside hydrolase family 71 protein n=1 Tax=Laetiporus sulphureus 93-53 TaxID=1314785 RepID=A0A165GV90_9APHY|nr:glycoside hydrolase family 71 protein [Laetiporus sulphureus 93-53]KZT10864.1 glycoside hydrolase family 71 protein [Laetiporus sulphureus 93-53]
MLSVSILLGTFAAFHGVVEAADVFAHFMVQNSYSYNASDWENDITTAANIGIDGFALNIAEYDYEVDRLVDAYSVAEAQGFKLFFSFDMSYSWSSDDMVALVTNYSSSSATYTYNGDVLVSTYSGESYGESFWEDFKTTLANDGVTTCFAPAFTTYRDPDDADDLVNTFASIDGFFNWWSWPDDVDANLTTATDLAYQAVIKDDRTGPYIMSVSPWQFKNLGTSDTDWVELSDTLWYHRWLQAIQDVQPDIVEIISWNDYAESHYIGDINPNVDLGDDAPYYVDGFVHGYWRNVAEHFISWYKTATEPTVTDDQVIFWYRAHPKNITCSIGTIPRNWEYPVDAVFALALLSEAATIQLDIGSNEAQWDAPAGASIGKVNFPTEDSQIPYIQIIRDGTTTKDGYGSEYVTQTDCHYYNFNPWVGIIE